jgi:hypothetical protein
VQVAAIAAALNDAATSSTAAEAARIASKNATVTFHNNTDFLRTFGSDLIKLIKAYADATGNPAVYTLASIPPPAAPSPLGPPAKPSDLSSTLTTAGSIDLEWKGSRQGGTSFNIFRATTTPGQPTGAWTLIGTSEKRKFTDSAVPTGLASVTYRVVAVRSGGTSDPSDVSTLFFGTAPGQNPAGGNSGLTLAA